MVRAKIIKLLEENIEKHNCKLNLGNSFLDLTQKVHSPRHAATAAAAKSLQSCPTLCDPTDGSTGLPRPWDSPGKNPGVGCHFLLHIHTHKKNTLSDTIYLKFKII